MINYDAFVVEVVPANAYMVAIDDYEITQTDEFVSRSTGRLCRRYTISVNEG